VGDAVPPTSHYIPGEPKPAEVRGREMPCHYTLQNYYCQIRRMLVVSVVNYSAMHRKKPEVPSELG